MTSRDPIRCKLPEGAELCFNIWLVVDAPTDTMLWSFVRGYILPGEDSKKLAMLRAAAATDYMLAEYVPLEQCVTQVGPDGRPVAMPCLSLKSVQAMGEFVFLAGAVGRIVADLEARFGFAARNDPLFVCTCLNMTDDFKLEPIGLR